MIMTTTVCEIDRVMDFICTTRDGEYTDEKPDLTQIIYARLDIQEADGANIFNGGSDEIILYGMSD